MRKVLYTLQLPMSFSCLHFKWSPFLFVYCLLRESDFIMCFNEAIKKVQLWNSSSPLYVSVLLCVSCTVTLAIWQNTLIWFDLLYKLISWSSCYQVLLYKKLGTHVFFSCVHRWFDFCRSRIWCVCHTPLCSFVFCKWWKLQEWQVEGL